MVAVPERAPDGGQRLVGELAREVHGDVPRPRDGRGAAGREELLERDAERRAGLLLDLADGRGRGRRGARDRARARTSSASSAVDRLAGERAVGHDADERALERADVGVDPLGDALERVAADVEPVLLRPLAQDGAGGWSRPAGGRR